MHQANQGSSPQMESDVCRHSRELINNSLSSFSGDPATSLCEIGAKVGNEHPLNLAIFIEGRLSKFMMIENHCQGHKHYQFLNRSGGELQSFKTIVFQCAAQGQ
jgi:hypothetical protein